MENNKCNQNIQARYEVTAFHLACGTGHLHVVQYIVAEKPCDVSVRDALDGTPAHDAAKQGPTNFGPKEKQSYAKSSGK